jgi:short-subunit dehydrogenase
LGIRALWPEQTLKDFQMSEFKSKTAIVTGGGTGIGAAVAVMLAARGANVVLVGRREADLNATAKRIIAAGGRKIWRSAFCG